MATFKCKMCGGALEVNEQMTVCECEYCGTQQTLPKINDEQKINMFNRANHFRQQCEFDKAAEIYEKLAAESESDAELFWSLVLCRYGIEYVDDPVTKNKIPTCHRTQFRSILEDPDYRTALECADSIQRKVYEQEALKIFNIQKGIIEISNKEKPYDVFICYKETDENGRRTQDSVLAQELYYGLVQEGFKVFFSRITLESKLGTEYEPYIFAALNSSKVMVVVGTKPEYFNAVWVRNEWSRYLQLMQKDKSKIIIPAYKDMDPYELPDSLSMFQSQDMSKLGFMQDLIRGIKKVTNKIDEQNIDRSIEQFAPVNHSNSNTPISQASADSQKKKQALVIGLAIIVILLLGIALLFLLFLVKGKNSGTDNEPSVPSPSLSEVISEVITENEEITPVETMAQDTENQNGNNPSDIQTVVSLSKEEVYSQYIDIVNSMDFVIPHKGLLTDLNGDGINEMIIPDVSDMTYKLYYYDGASIKSCSFGSFMALDNFVMYTVDGYNGKKYIYYRDNYSYKSKQGYFSFGEMSEIDIFLNFPSAGSGTCDWTIDYNGTENFATGTDNVNKVYGETKQCYAKILESFQKYGFAITDSSKYNSLNGLYYDDLIKQLR